MKPVFIVILFISLSLSQAFSQPNQLKKARLNFFNRTSIGYTFGINETLNQKKANAFHIKTVLGYALPKVGFGLGLETTTFNTTGTGNNSRFNTLSFTGNLHFLAKPIYEESLNFFLKGAAGYSPRVFNTYNKGFTYEAATGVIITNKKKNRFFIETKYHSQQIDDILTSSGKLEIKSVGLGIGTWF